MSLPPRTDLSPAVETARQSLGSFDAEPRIRASIRAHYDNLVRLAENLKRLGMDDHVIDESVMEVFGEYERELLRYVSARSAEFSGEGRGT